VERAGYKIFSAPTWGANFWVLNFAHTATKPLIDQLYIRQALAHLVDQPGYVRGIFKGYAIEQYGPIPSDPPNPLITSYEKSDPYPYSLADSESLLRGHGWSIVPNGTDTCTSPGTASSECGAGIAKGQRLELTDVYGSGVSYIDEINTSFISEAAAVGIKITGVLRTSNSILSDYGYTNTQTWDLEDWGGSSYPPEIDPTGDFPFGKGSAGNQGSYYDPKTQGLIDATVSGSGSVAAYDAYENYVTAQLPDIWQPLNDNVIAYKSDLSGTDGGVDGLTQASFTPEDYYFIK
jgi:peptide/nickel transport system substrate-binding protein